MNKDLAISLAAKVKDVAALFSNPNRQNNTNGETFVAERIHPLGDDSAAVFYKKSSGKQAIAFFYYLKGGINDWRYFFPTDSHLIGMQSFPLAKLQVELANYPMNFTEVQK